MNNIQVRKIPLEQGLTLPDALSSAATFTALDSWTRLVTEIYRYKIHRFEAIENDRAAGILALTEVKHPIFGHYLATSPFGSYGGFAYSTLAARDELLEAAKALANAQGVEHVNLRFEAEKEHPPEGWAQHPIYCTYRMDLLSDHEEMLQWFSSDHRNHIRKSLRKGFAIKFGQLELLDDAYECLARSMHELGSPYHHKSYLRAMIQFLGDAPEFAVLYDAHGALAGAGVFIRHGDVVTNLHANILREFRSEYAGEFLYWSAIEFFSRRGLKTFDLGRSLNGSGNETFKKKWKPRRIPLAYWYHLPKGGPVSELNQKSAKFQLAIWMWKRLPAFVVRTLGPHLIRGIV